MNGFNFTLDNYFNVCVALDNRVGELEDRLQVWKNLLEKDMLEGKEQNIIDIDNLIIKNTIKELEALNTLINDLEIHFNIKEVENNDV